MVDPRDQYSDTVVFYNDANRNQIRTDFVTTPLCIAISTSKDGDEQKILDLIPVEKQVWKVRNFNKVTVRELYDFCSDHQLATNRPINDILKDLFGNVKNLSNKVNLEGTLFVYSTSTDRIFNNKAGQVLLTPWRKLVEFQETKLKEFLLDPKPKNTKNRAPNLSDIPEEKTIDLSEESTPSGLVEQKSTPPSAQIDLDAADADLFNVPSSSVTANPIESGLVEEKLREEKVMPDSEEESSMVNTETYAVAMDTTLAVLFAKLSMLQKGLKMQYADRFNPDQVNDKDVAKIIDSIERHIAANDIDIDYINVPDAAISLLATTEQEFEQVLRAKFDGNTQSDAEKAIKKLVSLILDAAKRKLSQLTGRVRPADDPSDGFRAGDPFGGGRRRTDFEVAIKSPMQPMESYVWTDLGWLNPALSVFHGKTNGQLAIRQGDLVFRPRGKESSHVLDTTWNPTHFMGIALTGKSLMFAGQKINFPVALGGGLTTYNRSRAPLTPFVTLNPSMDSKCIEVLEGHHRSVGSLRHTERGSIVSLGWSVRGGPADTIVCY